MSKTIRRSVTSARKSFSGEAGIGIVQVMAGIILGAIIAAAGVFSTLAIIDWGQDNAAKTALEDVRTAQEVYLTQTADTDVNGGTYGTVKDLQDKNLISKDVTTVGTVAGENAEGGVDFGVASESKTGKTFVIDTRDGEVKELTTEGGTTLGAKAAAEIGK